MNLRKHRRLRIKHMGNPDLIRVRISRTRKWRGVRYNRRACAVRFGLHSVEVYWYG